MQKPDTKPGNYYVTVRRGTVPVDFRPLAGPFLNDHQAALDLVDEARKIACEVDPRGCWYWYGTARLPLDFTEPGILNERLGLPSD